MTVNCHVSSNNSTKHDGKIGYNSTMNIDSHDDTNYFGNKYRIVLTKEQICSVTAFLHKLATTNNVTIFTAATSMIDDDGTVLISVLGQGIEFTKKLDMVPINPKQCRSFGFQYIDNSTDSTRNLGFYANYVFLTLLMQGTD